MALVRNPGGHPTLSTVAVVLSDVRVGLGPVSKADVLAAAKHRNVPITAGRIDSAFLANIYFALNARRRA